MPSYYDYRNILNQIQSDTSATSSGVAEVISELNNISYVLNTTNFLLVLCFIVLPILRCVFRKR